MIRLVQANAQWLICCLVRQSLLCIPHLANMSGVLRISGKMMHYLHYTYTNANID